jgi:hypothetical protein
VLHAVFVLICLQASAPWSAQASERWNGPVNVPLSALESGQWKGQVRGWPTAAMFTPTLLLQPL